MRLPEIHRYGQVFNFVADNIQCWADAEGAQVWEVTTPMRWGPDVASRVLDHTEKDAQAIADSEITD